MNRSLPRWLKRTALALLTLVVAVAILGATYQALAGALDARRYPPPGQLVAMGGYRLHLHCLGPTGTGPTVVMDAGLGESSLTWWSVTPQAAQFARVCTFDRPGYGWSDPGPRSASAQDRNEELHALLHNARVPPPYVLVGHSLGGAYAYGYAQRYPDEVAGLVLVDPRHPDQEARLSAATLAGDRQYTERMLPLFPWIARLGFGRLILSFTPQDFDALPALQREQVRAFWARPEHWAGQRWEALATSASDAQTRATGTLGDRQLIVVSAAGPANDVRGVWDELHPQLATLSTRGTHRVIAGADHASLALKREHALQTSGAIREVVETVRTTTGER